MIENAPLTGTNWPILGGPAHSLKIELKVIPENEKEVEKSRFNSKLRN